jgi:RND family efflux transporter MFP subunit
MMNGNLGKSHSLPVRPALSPWRCSFGAIRAAGLIVALGCGRANSPLAPVATDPSAVDSGQAVGANPPSARTELPKVLALSPVRKAIVQKTEQPGQISPYASTPIHAKANGFIDQLRVDIGDRVEGPKKNSSTGTVEPGQVLAVLSAPELNDERMQKEALLAKAEAQTVQAQASVEVALSMSDRLEAMVDESQAAEKKVEAALERWRSESQRLVALAESKTVTAKMAEEATMQYRATQAEKSEANARVRSAKAKLQEANMEINKARADLQAARSEKAVAQAECQRLQSLCEYLTIRAPYTGIITERHVDLGHLVHASHSANDKPLFVLVHSDRLRVAVDVPEVESHLVAIGCQALIKIPTASHAAVEGKIARTSWALQPGSRALRCEVDVENPDGTLRPGMYANVEIILAKNDDALTIPKAALGQQDGKNYCLVIGPDHTLERRSVSVGIRSPAEVEILDGLESTDRIVGTNLGAFQAGQRVAP